MSVDDGGGGPDHLRIVLPDFSGDEPEPEPEAGGEDAAVPAEDSAPQMPRFSRMKGPPMHLLMQGAPEPEDEKEEEGGAPGPAEAEDAGLGSSRDDGEAKMSWPAALGVAASHNALARAQKQQAQANKAKAAAEKVKGKQTTTKTTKTGASTSGSPLGGLGGSSKKGGGSGKSSGGSGGGSGGGSKSSGGPKSGGGPKSSGGPRSSGGSGKPGGGLGGGSGKKSGGSGKPSGGGSSGGSGRPSSAKGKSKPGDTGSGGKKSDGKKGDGKKGDKKPAPRKDEDKSGSKDKGGSKDKTPPDGPAPDEADVAPPEAEKPDEPATESSADETATESGDGTPPPPPPPPGFSGMRPPPPWMADQPPTVRVERIWEPPPASPAIAGRAAALAPGAAPAEPTDRDEGEAPAVSATPVVATTSAPATRPGTHNDSELTVDDVIEADRDMAEELAEGAASANAVIDGCDLLMRHLEDLAAQIAELNVPGSLPGGVASLMEMTSTLRERAAGRGAGLLTASERLKVASDNAETRHKPLAVAVKDAGHARPAEPEYHKE